MVPRRRLAKKLLVASVGVAAVSYVVACNKQPVGNLAMPAADAADMPAVGNLMAPPPPPIDAAPTPRDIPPGNLMPPPPPPLPDAGKPKAR